jgi:branched-chain amino acid transport system permease protein
LEASAYSYISARKLELEVGFLVDPFAGLETVLVFAAVAGASFSLLSIGFSLMFGVAKIIDFTYVGYVVAASYLVYTFTGGKVMGTSIGGTVPLGVALLISVLGVLPIAIFVERVLIRPMIRNGTAVMMATFGMALLIQYLATLIWGPIAASVVPYFPGSFTILHTIVSTQRFIVIPVGLLAIIGVVIFLNYTKYGKSIIAVSDDSDAAWLVGINVNNTYILAIVLAAGLAATAAVLTAPTVGLQPGMGWGPFTTAFIVTVFGGLGSLPGAVIASYVYAIFLNAVSVFVGPQWADTAALVFLIALLFVVPKGILGKRAA